MLEKLSNTLDNFVVPVWLKYVVISVLLVTVWGHGYTKGQANVYEKQLDSTAKLVYIQGKTTTKVITKYIKQKEKQAPIEEQIKKEGQSYAIQFPNDYTFNNEYVRLFNQSVTGNLSTLPSGEPSQSSGVTVSRQLDVSINNNTVAREWKERALTCELWAKTQEEESNK